MFDLRLVIITAFSAFIIGATSSWWVTSDYKNAKHEQVLAAMRTASLEALQIAQQKALDIERKNVQLATELEVQNVQARQKLDLLASVNRRLTTEYAGLYDRHATSSGSTQCPTTSSTTKPAHSPTGTRLSDALTELLLSESRRADEAATYAQTCYAWIQQIKENHVQ